MFDPERLLKQMLGGTLGGAFGGGRRASRGLGSAMGVNKAAVGLGVLGVAMAAYQHYSQAQANKGAGPATLPPASPTNALPAMMPAASMAPPPPPPAMSAPTRAQPILDLHRQEAALMVRAMIAAAAADGAIDDAERSRIVERARGALDDADTLAYLQAELDNPVQLDEMVAQTPRSLAEPVYAASLLAITLDSEAEQTYLGRLADGLGIAPERRAALHSQLGLG